MSRVNRVEKHCASCLKPMVRGVYCSPACKAADAAWLRARLAVQK